MALGAHLVNGVIEGVSPLAIGVLVVGPSYCQLLLLVGGFVRHVRHVRHVRRERRFGRYRDWRAGVDRGAGWVLS